MPASPPSRGPSLPSSLPPPLSLPPHYARHPPQEAQLREAEALLDDLGSAQGFARSLAARWVAALRGVAAAGADLGVALAALAEYEGSCRRVDSAGLQVAAQVGGRRGGWGGGRWVAGGWRGVEGWVAGGGVAAVA